MKELLITYLPWLLSALTIYMTVLAGNKNKYAWIIGGVNQSLWFIWIVYSQNWGLLPMNIALWFLYIRNFHKWNTSDNGGTTT